MRLEVVPCNNALSAQLRIHEFSPEGWKAQFRDLESLCGLLFQNGIAREFIDKSSLQIVYELLNNIVNEDIAGALEEAHSIVVASGVPSSESEVVGLRLLKAYLSTDAELSSLKARLASQSFELLQRDINPGCVVQKGAVILGFSAIKPGTPGIDVFGKSLPPNPYGSSLPRPGNAILEEGNNWIALKQGILVVEDNTFKILGPRSPQDSCILIAPDKMSVRLVLRFDEDDDFKPTVGFLEEYLSRQQFAISPDMDRIGKTMEAFASTGKNQDVVILTGKPCVEGKNGSLELLLNPEPALPEPDNVGRIDFKTFSYFRTVKKGTPLARVIAPESGRIGMDVYGNPLLPKEITAFGENLGKNTELTITDPAFIVAGCDGRLVMSNGLPEIVDTLQIKDDVSLKTGNITFPGSVEVGGDVRDNLEINAKGDVDIAGIVENGSIVSEGAIVVKGGFTGTGKGVIKSRLSSVSIGFIRNQRIESHSDIIVFNEVVNAHLCAKKTISMKSVGHSVVGGHLIAYTGIEIYNSGNETGSKTILEVGKDFEVEAELIQKKSALQEIHTDLDFLERMLEKMQSLVRWGIDVKGDTRLLEQRARGILQLLRPLKSDLAKKIRELEDALFNPGDCYIWVKGTVYPGTILRYQDRNVIVKDVVKGKRWLFRGKSSSPPNRESNHPEFR